MRARAELLHVSSPENSGLSQDKAPQDLFLVKQKGRNGRYIISPVIFDAGVNVQKGLPFRKKSDYGSRSSGISIVNPPGKLASSVNFHEEASRIGEIKSRHHTIFDRIPLARQLKHAGEVIFGGENERSNIAVEIAKENISSGQIEIGQINQHLKELQTGDARWIVIDSTLAIPVEFLVVSMNTAAGIDAIVVSENKIIGALIGVGLGIVIQGAIRNVYFIPRTVIEGIAYFNKKERTPEEVERFKKVYGSMFGLTFVPGIGVIMLTFISYLRNEKILKPRLDRYKNQGKDIVSWPKRALNSRRKR